MSSIDPTSSIGATPATTPLQLAAAYGVTTPRPAAAPAARLGVHRADSVELASIRPAERATAATDRLVAARFDLPAVEDGPDAAGFPQIGSSAPVGRSAGDMPFYRHPADQNRAATEISLGRSLDVSG